MIKIEETMASNKKIYPKSLQTASVSPKKTTYDYITTKIQVFIKMELELEIFHYALMMW